MTEMTYRPLGDSGLMVSAVGIGCNAFGRRVDLDGVREILGAARETGVTLLDTADIYAAPPGASEELLGQALAGQRDEFVLATKFGMDMQGANGNDFGARAWRRYVRRAVEASLERLQTDHIDLYQLHQPDGVTPIEETLSALTDLVREGRCATSAARTSTAGRSRTRPGPRGRRGSRGSCRCRTATRCSTVPSRRR